MSARVFVDGGWIGLAISREAQATSPSFELPQALTGAEAMRLAADLVDAASGPTEDGPGIPAFLRDLADQLDAAEVTEPGRPNGTEYASVGR